MSTLWTEAQIPSLFPGNSYPVGLGEGLGISVLTSSLESSFWGVGKHWWSRAAVLSLGCLGNEIKEASVRDIWPLRVFRRHPLPPHLPTFGQAG